MRPRPRLASLLAALATLGAAAVARAADPEPQQHEVDAIADITVENRGNAAYLEARYVFTPDGLDRLDEVVPILRRFVRHPTTLWLGVKRNGSTWDAQTGAFAGGTVELLDRRVYLGGQVGVESDDIVYDRLEEGYWAAPFRVEAGGRPLELLSLGAYYEGRPILSANVNPDIVLPTYRDGGEQTIGGTISFSTPNDRFILTLKGGWYTADWTFTGFHPGGMNVEGPVAHLHLDYQLSAGFSIGFVADFSREHWVDTRQGDEELNYIGPDLDRIVYRGLGMIEIVYWFKGKVGFRFALGGGYSGEAPLIGDLERGISRAGFGLISRF